ncbi:chlorohydrolase [Streptococcus pneumoniae]|nr:chlorohydrolase [Streptococcus pneumoniae]
MKLTESCNHTYGRVNLTRFEEIFEEYKTFLEVALISLIYLCEFYVILL